MNFEVSKKTMNFFLFFRALRAITNSSKFSVFLSFNDIIRLVLLFSSNCLGARGNNSLGLGSGGYLGRGFRLKLLAGVLAGALTGTFAGAST
jgi:hypothetical protein